jgi:hypothetical protein
MKRGASGGPRLGRRGFLAAASSSAALFVIPFRLGATETAGAAGFTANAFLRLDAKGVVVLSLFYVGAVGSRRRHEMRYKMLRRQMPHEDVAARLRMSVGTIPAARDPSTLALSILAQIVAVDAASAVGERAARDAGDLPNQSIGAH